MNGIPQNVVILCNIYICTPYRYILTYVCLPHMSHHWFPERHESCLKLPTSVATWFYVCLSYHIHILHVYILMYAMCAFASVCVCVCVLLFVHQCFYRHINLVQLDDACHYRQYITCYEISNGYTTHTNASSCRDMGRHGTRKGTKVLSLGNPEQKKNKKTYDFPKRKFKLSWHLQFTVKSLWGH